MKLHIHSQTSTVQPFKFDEWISKFIPQFIMNAITYPCWDVGETMLVKWAIGDDVAVRCEMHYETVQLSMRENVYPTN